MININNLKVEQLKKILDETVFLENETLFYSNPVSFQTLEKVLKFDLKKGKEILIQLTNKDQAFDKPLSEEIMQNFLLELGIDFEKLVLANFYERLQTFLFRNNKPDKKRSALVVTVMGHVDHGKTSLLDVIRNSKLINKEHGQITQKVGGYQIEYQNQKLTFIDTPGHNLFSDMRAQGANITDLVILVVSGSEGVKQQTIEAINHAKAAKVPVLVFVNKMDLPKSDLERTIDQVAKYGLMPKKWGGRIEFIPGSCLKKEGIENLLKAVIKIGTDLDLATDFNSLAKAVVLDSYVDKQGINTSLIVKKGTLKLGDLLIANDIFGKVKALINDQNQKLKSVTPGMCIKLLGLTKPVPSGTTLYQFPTEKLIQNLIKDYQYQKEKANEISEKNARSLFLKSFWNTEDTKNDVNIIIKYDTIGVEKVIRDQINLWNLNKKEMKFPLNFVHIGIDHINQSDINLALVSKAVFITYNLKLNNKVKDELKSKKIDHHNFYLLYELFDYLDKLQKGKLVKEYFDRTISEAKVLQVFDHSKLGKIAGCVVLRGTVTLSKNPFKILRNNKVIATNLKVKSLQQKKDVLASISQNQEFGIIFNQKVAFQPGDIIIQFESILKND